MCIMNFDNMEPPATGKLPYQEFGILKYFLLNIRMRPILKDLCNVTATEFRK